ncbi:hypothetical protein SeMB42_g06388 [Synchytrium endobioticum]|uniref:Eukaryotic translation initiation factor 3 subunit G n=1 Tax=Synchytrium endobioticum TaxID=286115 RepID=A0A507CNC3_9FUNG|nr:hypothetical protein SeMB42_g06388 [Synchytrium endobioticum]TPX40624.1 hypothetical protein SeLEV6574_g06526 [Synchytrium endobioticum]
MTSATIEDTSTTKWADDVEDTPDDEIAPAAVTVELPPPAKVHYEEDGTKVLTEYRINEDGKKVKVTLKMKLKTVKIHANKAVAERKAWKKFGDAKGLPSGPDPSTTTYGEKVYLKLSTSGKDLEQAEPDDSLKQIKARLSSSRIVCRTCKGDHYTYRCPFKDSSLALGNPESKEPSTATLSEAPVTDDPSSSKPGKYVPPSLRGGPGAAARGPGESMNTRNREDFPTIRITNLSEDASEGDVKDLVERFGNTSRVFVARDPKTNVCKGFAFVSYYDKINAERAMNSLDGYGYDNLILRVEWAKASRD